MPEVIHLIAAARPNFMKIAPLYHTLRKQEWCEPVIVHTGQHYDANMSDAFFRDLMLPTPHHHLEVGSGTHAQQTAGVMVAYEKVCLERAPSRIIVVGDVNSTLAGALVGTKLCIPVIHLEAGLRSGDRRMPEEINRLATDAICDLLWTPSPDADDNLLREGVPQHRIERVGNIMIDSYEMFRPRIEAAGTRERLGLPERYGVVTLHRPSNVDHQESLRELTEQLIAASADMHLIFAVHPRTLQRLKTFDLLGTLQSCRSITLTEPLGYIEFMNLVQGSAAVITDSGGVQEESTYLGIPCLTLRENTERPITISEGTNRLIRPQQIVTSIGEVNTGRWPSGKRPEFWDGHTAQRCAQALERHLRAASR